MKTSTDRILTTHTGSLPRPKPLIDLILGREKGTAVAADAFEAATAKAVDEVVAQQVACRHRRGHRRRNVEAVLHDLYPPSRRPASRRTRAPPTKGRDIMIGRDLLGASGFRPRPPAVFRRAVSRLRRRTALQGPLGARPRHRASQSRRGEGEADRSVHDRAVARHPDALHHQPALSDRGRLRRRARRGAQGRIPRHRRSRLRAADRRARSRLGAQQPVPRI